MRLGKPLIVASFLLALLGCDNKNDNSNKTTTAPTNNQQVTTNNTATSAQPQQSQSRFTPTDSLIKKYHDKQLKIIDSSEMILEGSSTLVVTFSVPLDPKQNFTNLIRLVDNEKGYVDGAWELSDNGLELRHRYLEPNRKLTVTIDKMLLAINDSRLKESYQTELTTRNRQPMVGFASKGLLLPSKSMSGLPVMTMNVDKVDINFFKIKSEKLSAFMTDIGLMNKLSTWNYDDFKSYVDLVYSSRFDLNPRLNTQETILVNLSSINELQQEGVYIAVLNQAGSYNESNPATLFSISNIGVSVHAYENGKMIVLTHALDNGTVLPNIKVSALCKRYSRNNDSKNTCETVTATTDKQGFAELTLPSSDYMLLTANDDSQTSFVFLDSGALNLSEFNLSGTAFYDKQLFAFGPRDLYRPQETVYLNALLRDADGNLLPNQPIKVDVMTPDGKSIKEFVWKPESQQQGFYQTKYVIPSNAATGKWSFRFNLGDDNYRYFKFSVEEFLPERMAMEITTPSDKPILADDSIDFDIKGWYLYGAPASGNSIEGNVYLKKVDALPTLKEYKIGQVTETNINRQIDTIEQKLNSDGMTEISIASKDLGNWKSPVKVILQASLLDSGGRPVTRTTSQTIWPAEKMPAVRALFADSEYYDWASDSYKDAPTVDKGGLAEFDVIYVDQEGNKLATNSLKARIVRERRDSYWEWSESRGWQNRYNLKELVVSEEQLTIAENGSTKVSYQPDDYGSYRIEVIDTKKSIVSSLRFWSGYDWEDNTDGNYSVRPDQVKLSLDKTLYSVGDTAKIHVQAPVAGSGYISLETNDGMLWKKEINVDENGLDVEIPIENWGRHDIYLSAMIIRPSTDATVQTVKRAIGLLYLPIDTSNRQLGLTIEAPEKTQPEKTVAVKVKMDPKFINKEHKVTVLVSAVDSGVLNITNFETPDPYSAFLGRKRYNVDLYDVYGRLIEAKGRQVSMSFGGDIDDMAAGGKKPLTEVNIVAQQLKTIELDQNGEGVVELALPDFNGEVRLMVQAWDDNRFGRAEKPMIVAAPVIAELSTPRFLAGGDRAILALDLHNLTSTKQPLQINVTTTGLVHQERTLSSIVPLDAKQRQVVKIPVISDYGFGQGSITVNVKGIVLENGEDYQLSRTWKVGVRPPYAATVKNYAVALNGGESWTLPGAAIVDLINITIESKLVASNQPPLNIAQYIKELFAYPYGCLEQTTSGLYPALYANHQQLAALGINSDPDDVRREKVQLGIDRILGMQRNNGSFGLWSRDSNEEYWLTVYATDFLLKARERGYQVNNDALEKAMTRLGQYVYASDAFNNMSDYYNNTAYGYTKFATKTYAIMILAKQNKITPAVRNEINRLYQQTINNNGQYELLSPLPIAQLALSAKLAGFEHIFDDLIPIALETRRYESDYWVGDYGSAIRDKAIVYSMLVENGIAVNKQAAYLFNLSDTLNDKRYFSTQELNALFVAGWTLEQSKTKQSFAVNVNKELLKSDKALYRSFNFNTLADGLTITNPDNAAPLYLKFTVSGYSKQVPAPTSTNNMLTIKRSYYDVKGNEISPYQLKVGDLVMVVLDVSSKNIINDALIVDFLPAGLELENQNLMNSSVNVASIPALANLLKNQNSNDLKYQEYRDDRYVAAVSIRNYSNYRYRSRVAYLARAVTAGDYVVPNPFVESMYRPEWFAIGQSPDIMSIIERDATN